ncbi:hypothetical protein ACS0TY_000379 [Phlomoides rotata]
MIFISQAHDQSITNELLSVYVEEVRQGIDSFVEMVKKIKNEYKQVFEGGDDEEEDEDDDDEEEESSRSDFGGKKTKLVGVSDQLTKIKDELSAAYKSYELGVVSFVGVAGTGRSYYAREIFDTRNDKCYDNPLFKLRAWVPVGRKYKFQEVLVNILSQIHDHPDKIIASQAEEKMMEYLYTRLKSGRYLIVFDDVGETGIWEDLKNLFPDENNGSRIFLTTHLEEVALFAKSISIYRTEKLRKQESWNLLSTVLFPKRRLRPPEFEKAGKKIVENCRGLHVEVAKVAILLSKVGKKPEHWDKVAAEMESSVANISYNEMIEISEIKRGDSAAAKTLEKVLGLPYEIIGETMNNEFPNPLNPNLRVVALVGMAGIGKTALAREIFEDPWALRCYEHRVWLSLGPKCYLKRMLGDIVGQLDPNVEHRMHTKEHEESAKQIIRSILSGKRCLMVLDNAWEDNVRHLKNILGHIKCEVLLTTRRRRVTAQFWGSRGIQTIPFLNKEESWNLLRERVFGEELCPRELEIAGKMIAEDCDGLPLTIVTVASILSKADEKTPEYWNEVAMKKNSVFEDAYHKISKVLYPSYKNLDLAYKTGFLYMAAFRPKYEIPISKLFMLCAVEGLLHSDEWNLIRDFIAFYLGMLADESLVLIQDKKYNGQAKTCRLHSAFWHLCAREAGNDKFLHVVKRYADCLSQVIDNQRRLCIQNNVLFGIKDAYNSMSSVSTARSLLCYGPPHQYQLPICFDHWKLLKVLDALSMRFYEFPVGILELVLLRYLALTYDGKIAAHFISKLCNLDILIILQHMSIRFPGDLSYLPTEIWDMKELNHLQIKGRNLPDDPPAAPKSKSRRARLEKLTTLLDVRPESCTKSILERIPNLAKLGVRVELEPNTFNSSFSFDSTSHLKRLKSLKCVVVNPELKSAPHSFSKLPTPLNKLSLSGFGYSWEHVRPIASLPYLLVLKLKCYAFRGAEWVMHEGDFNSLHYLLLEDTDLVHWTAAGDYCSLNSLKLLIIRNCYKLKHIPWQCIPPSCKVELVDCNPSALDQIPPNYSACVYSSWELVRNSTASSSSLRGW